MVCTGGGDDLIGHIRGWDSRQGGMGSPLTPVFDVEYRNTGGFEDLVYAMIPVGSSGTPPQLLTGVF
jgi:hypothetical protein